MEGLIWSPKCHTVPASTGPESAQFGSANRYVREWLPQRNGPSPQG